MLWFGSIQISGTRWNCPILKYWRSILSESHCQFKYLPNYWPKICKSLWISGFIGFLYIEWAGAPVTKVFWWAMKMKILWMLVVIVSQPVAALPQFWIFPSTSHCDTLIDFSWLIILITRFFITFWINALLHSSYLHKIQVDHPHDRNKKYKPRYKWKYFNIGILIVKYLLSILKLQHV